MPTILVVDDNFENRDIIGRMLRISGYTIISAVNGSEALEVLKHTIPDLILMDLAMPVMDGWTATSLIKAQPHLANVPIIAVTGHMTNDNLDRAFQIGCVDHLPKPIDYDLLVTKVKTHLATLTRE